MTTYYSLTEALKDADKVRILDLSDQQLTILPPKIRPTSPTDPASSSYICTKTISSSFLRSFPT